MHWPEKVITLAWWATLCWAIWSDGQDQGVVDSHDLVEGQLPFVQGPSPWPELDTQALDSQAEGTPGVTHPGKG
jgi:hypothetical protein